MFGYGREQRDVPNLYTRGGSQSGCDFPSESKPLGCIDLRLRKLPGIETEMDGNLKPLPMPLGRSVTGERTGCRPDNEGYTNVAVAGLRARRSRLRRERRRSERQGWS